MSSAKVGQAFGHPLTHAQREHRQRVSETAAEETLQGFLTDRGICYSGGISSPNTAFVCGSRLSVHLAWGTLSGRQAYAATAARQAELTGLRGDEATRWRRSLKSFKSRLHWRDHFVQRLETAPQQEFEPLNAAYAALPTPGDEHLDAWLAGQTGWPLVDACMRCLDATGFLNFRMRAMVTSVAVHTLRIDWRKTLYPMARRWADYVPGIHISQTQMQAGVVGNLDGQRAELSALVGESQSAVGALQATQAGNQLLALQSQQIADLIAVVAANGRATTLVEAERSAAAEQGRVQRERFLTPGAGYQPGNARMFNN